MKFTIDRAVFKRFPNVYVGVVVAYGLNLDMVDDEAIDVLLDNAMGDLTQRFKNVEQLRADPAIKAWREAFTALGYNPNKFPSSIEALAGRALKGKMPRVNPVVDVANSVALKYLLPIGAHDLGRAEGDLALRPAREGDFFTPRGEEEAPERPDPGEFVYIDDSGEVRTRRWVWRQGNNAKIEEDTTAVFFPIDGWNGVNDDAVRAATDALAELVQTLFSAPVQTFHLDAEHPGVSWQEGGPDSGERRRSSDRRTEPRGLPIVSEVRERIAPAAPQVSVDEDIIQDILKRGTVDIIVREDLEKALRSGRQLRVKFGIDPTSSKVHLGRAVPIRKMRQFQRLGHHTIIIIGDFTGMVGDASDKEATRTMLTREQVSQNMATYIDQINSILDAGPVEYRHNSEWLDSLDFHEIIGLASQFTVAQMLQRENFAERWRDEKPIGLQELMYPLLQGYDSVAIEADVELGGTDQLFNLLAGRTIQRAYGQKPQDIITNLLIPGLDGRKMSSSWGNTTNIVDDPNDMFGKLMSISDEQMPTYFEMTTDLPLSDVATINEAVRCNELHPMEAKKRLASEVVKLYHGQAAADEARAGFERVFQKRDLPEEIPTVLLKDTAPRQLLDLLIQTGLAPSRKQARQLVDQGGVSVNGEKMSDPFTEIVPTPGMVVKKGSRNFVKLHIAAHEPAAIRAALQQAIANHHRVLVDYNYSEDGQRAGVVTDGRAIHPHRFATSPHGEYVEATDLVEQKPKRFQLSGITRLTSTGEPAASE